MASDLELLTPREDREEPFLTHLIIPIAGATVAFLASCFRNYGTRRPILSGIQRHAMWIVAGATVGKAVDTRRSGYLAEKDAVLRHYIELHPDDFPDRERKTYAELFEPWYPIR